MFIQHMVSFNRHCVCGRNSLLPAKKADPIQNLRFRASFSEEGIREKSISSKKNYKMKSKLLVGYEVPLDNLYNEMSLETLPNIWEVFILLKQLAELKPCCSRPITTN